MTRAFEGLQRVTRIKQPNRPNVFLFEIDRDERERGPLYVAGERRDAFSGEDEPPTPVEIPRSSASVNAIDIFGEEGHPQLDESRLYLNLSDTPVYLEADCPHPLV